MSRVSVTKSQRYPKWSVCNVCAAQQVLINMLLQSAIRYTAWCWQWSWLRWKSGKWFLFQGRWSDDFVQREVSARIIRIDVVASRCWFHSGQLLFSLLAVRQCNFKWKSTAPLPHCQRQCCVTFLSFERLDQALNRNDKLSVLHSTMLWNGQHI